MAEHRKFRVFVSSVVGGMETVRAAVRERLAAEFDVRNCENWPARPIRPWEACREEVLSSDLLVLLLGSRYGARCPERPGLSYSEAEYRTAIEAGDPRVVAYLVESPPGAEAPQSADDLALLEKLGTEVRDTLFAPVIPVVDVANRVQEAVVEFLRREGYGGGDVSTYQRWDVRYRGELAGSGFFHHRHALVAREDALEQLRAFISSTSEVGVLVGGAGQGKSRLLIEAARTHADAKRQPPIRFLAASPQPIAPETLVQLPMEAVLVVLDDAHARGSLAADIETLLSRRTGGVRLLLATRPEGEAFVRSALRSLATTWLPPLTSLKGDGTDLALDLLGADRRSDARRIAVLSAGVPLFITVGCALLKEGALALADVVSHDDYRALVFERVLRGTGPAPSDDEERVLTVVSAIGPLRADSEAAPLVARVGHLDLDRAANGLSDAIGRGLIIKRGFQYSIVPDLLSDFVLRRACVTKVGIPTGFLDGLDVSDLGSEGLANVVKNALVVEYLQRQAGQPVDLLGALWSRLTEALRDADPAAARAALDRLVPVARIAAAPLIEIAVAILPRMLRPDLQYPLSQLRTSLVQLLIECGQDQAYSREAARALCLLASEEPDDGTTARREACSGLEQLASYGRPPAYGRQGGIVEAVIRAYRDGILVGEVVPGVLSKSLEREGEWMESDNRVMHMGSFAVSPEATAAVRDRASAALVELAMGPRANIAAKAVDALAQLLGHWPGKFARVPGADERAGWVPEATKAVGMLVQIATEAPLDTTRALARRRIQEQRRRGHALGEIPRPRALASCAATLEVRVVDAMLEPLDDGITDEKPWEAAARRNKRACVWLARAILRTRGIAKEIVEYLHPIAERVAAMNVRESHVGAWPLVQAFGEVDPELRLPLHGEICRVGGHLGGGLQQIHAELLQRGEKALARRALTAAMDSGRADVRRDAAVTLRWLCSTEPIETADVTLLAPLLSDGDLAVRKFAIAAIGPLAKGQLEAAKDLLVRTDPGDTWPLIDELLDQVGPKDVPLSSLSDAEVAALLEKIPALCSLGMTNNAYHVSLFLKDVALSRPVAFVDWTLARLPSGPDVDWADVHLSLEELRRLIDPDDIESAERARLVDALLERLANSDGLKSAGIQPLAVLLAWASSVDEVMPRVANLLLTADEAGFGRIVRGLVEFGETLVFGSPAAMAELFEHAKRIGGHCEDLVSSVAFEAVNPGTVSVGEHPIPAYDGIAKRAAECGATAANPALKEMFRTLEATYRDMSMRHDEWE